MRPQPERIFVNEKQIQDLESKFSIIHFNDVYNIEGRTFEPVGGAARFVTMLDYLKSKNPSLVIFSGDALSPSSISMVMKGKQVIEILNKCYIDCACLGNHEFDFGMDVLQERIAGSNFPWLISNVFDAETQKPLGGVEDRKICEINGFKIGLIGLSEEDWIQTISTVSYDEIDYESYIKAGKRLATQLKYEDGCDFVIAMTHMRWVNDKILAERVPEIDLYLGGHDHDYDVRELNGRWVIKSGTDFRMLSLIELARDDEKRLHVNKIDKYMITAEIDEKPEVKAVVDSYVEECNKGQEDVLGYMNSELDGRFPFVRTSETNLGNFVCDILLANVEADFACVNGGSLRSDTVNEVGEFKVKHLKKILPYIDECVVISITGSIIHEMLENSVSKWPEHEGRFLQVSGITFAFDPSKPVGERVDRNLIKIQNEPLELEKKYSMATKKYIFLGKDGYKCLRECPLIVDGDDIPCISNLVANHIKTCTEMKANEEKRFRPSIVPIHKVNKIMEEVIKDPVNEIKREDTPVTQRDSPSFSFIGAVSVISRLREFRGKCLNKKQRRLAKMTEAYKAKIATYEIHAMKLAPKIENRIIRIESPEHHQQLLKGSEKNPMNKKLHAKILVEQRQERHVEQLGM